MPPIAARPTSGTESMSTPIGSPVSSEERRCSPSLSRQDAHDNSFGHSSTTAQSDAEAHPRRRSSVNDRSRVRSGSTRSSKGSIRGMDSDEIEDGMDDLGTEMASSGRPSLLQRRTNASNGNGHGNGFGGGAAASLGTLNPPQRPHQSPRGSFDSAASDAFNPPASPSSPSPFYLPTIPTSSAGTATPPPVTGSSGGRRSPRPPLGLAASPIPMAGPLGSAAPPRRRSIRRASSSGSALAATPPEHAGIPPPDLGSSGGMRRSLRVGDSLAHSPEEEVGSPPRAPPPRMHSGPCTIPQRRRSSNVVFVSGGDDDTEDEDLISAVRQRFSGTPRSPLAQMDAGAHLHVPEAERVHDEAPARLPADAGVRSPGSMAPTPSPTRQDLSSHLRDYTLEKTVGEGAFAKVKLATHTLSGIQVAIKIIYKDRIKEDYVRRNLRREGELMRALHHPHVVRLYEIVETDHIYALVMEMASGGEILDYIVAHGTLSEKEARKYTRQIVSAIGYLHRNDVVHRDLKAENLLLDNNLDIKVVDFGLSNSIAGRDFLSTQCGSPAYSAPELLGGKSYGKEVDVYSIGVNLYAMLTGRLPFKSNNVTTLHALILDKAYHVPEHLSPECVDLLSKLLMARAKDRISLEELCQHPWVTAGSLPPVECTGLPFPGIDSELDNEILQYMAQYGFDAEATTDAVHNASCNHDAATYELLALKKARRGRLTTPNRKNKSRSLHRAATTNDLQQAQQTAPPAPTTTTDAAPPRRRSLRKSTHMSLPTSRQTSAGSEGRGGTQSTQRPAAVLQAGARDAGAANESNPRRGSLREQRPSSRRVTTPSNGIGEERDFSPAARPSQRPSALGPSRNASDEMSPGSRNGSSHSPARRLKRVTSDNLSMINGTMRAAGAGSGYDDDEEESGGGGISGNLDRPRRASIHGMAGLRQLAAAARGSLDGGGSRTRAGSFRATPARRNSLSQEVTPGDAPKGRLSNGSILPEITPNNVASGTASRNTTLNGSRRRRRSEWSFSEEPTVRTLRYPLNRRMVSQKPPQEVYAELRRVLEQAGAMTHRLDEDAGLSVRCTLREVIFDAEIVKLPGLAMHGVHFKRIRGDSTVHNNLCIELIDEMQL